MTSARSFMCCLTLKISDDRRAFAASPGSAIFNFHGSLTSSRVTSMQMGLSDPFRFIVNFTMDPGFPRSKATTAPISFPSVFVESIWIISSFASSPALSAAPFLIVSTIMILFVSSVFLTMAQIPAKFWIWGEMVTRDWFVWAKVEHAKQLSKIRYSSFIGLFLCRTARTERHHARSTYANRPT